MHKKLITSFIAATTLVAGIAVANPLISADADNAPATDPMAQQIELALSLYESGSYLQALTLAQEAAEKGNADAQMLLATMYKDGSGVDQSFTQAKVWYEQAGKQGHVLAQFHLGVMYEQGLGTPQDFRQAMNWYSRAGEMNFNYAQFNLAMMYLQGRGTESNLESARKWFQQSCNNGIQMGCEAAQLLTQGIPAGGE